MNEESTNNKPFKLNESFRKIMEKLMFILIGAIITFGSTSLNNNIQSNKKILSSKMEVYNNFQEISIEVINYAHFRDLFTFLRDNEYNQLLEENKSNKEFEFIKDSLFDLSMRIAAEKEPKLQEQYFNMIEIQGKYIMTAEKCKYYFSEQVDQLVDSLDYYLTPLVFKPVIFNKEKFTGFQFSRVSIYKTSDAFTQKRKKWREDICAQIEKELRMND